MRCVKDCVTADEEQEQTKKGTLEVLRELAEEVRGRLEVTENPKLDT